MSKRKPADPERGEDRPEAPAAGTPALDPADRVATFERAIREASRASTRYVLRLYVTGSTPRSTKAIQNIRALCEEHLRGRYDLEVIDIYQQPVLARGEQIIAAPTLIKRLPEPLRKVVGDLSNTDRVLMGLDLRPAGDGGPNAAGDADAGQ
jgi:circadian clock protein KaiB